METRMTRAELVDTLRTERENWESLLAEIGRERMTQPGATGEWSVKDVIAHVTYYEQWLANWLEAAQRGEVLARTGIDEMEMHERNAVIYGQNRDLPLDEVLAQSRQSFERVLQSVQALSEQDVTDPSRFERYIAAVWDETPPLWECIAGDSFGHYAEHITPIRAWLELDGGK